MKETEKPSGTVLQLQRMSVHDGPGIRTTVFLKGCPLHCGWCHNPESQSGILETAYRKEKCVGCGLCVEHCPANALRLAGGKIVRNLQSCLHCMKCSEVCPSFAWTAYGKKMTVDEVCTIVIQDKAYYNATSGGVTFSGGEPLAQVDFVVACEKKLLESDISTAVETSCFGSPDDLCKLAEYTDFFMVDIKTMDESLHQKWTGASNRQILSNIQTLSKLGCKTLIRIPIVVGVSDGVENIRNTAKFLLEKTNFRQVELLRMHKHAEKKYRSLERNYPAEHLEPPSDVCMEEAKQELQKWGIEVIGQ